MYFCKFGSKTSNFSLDLKLKKFSNPKADYGSINVLF